MHGGRLNLIQSKSVTKFFYKRKAKNIELKYNNLTAATLFKFFKNTFTEGENGIIGIYRVSLRCLLLTKVNA